MSAPSVSVIVPAFNAVSYLTEAVASVRAQGHEPIEIIVVDDGSTDGTAPVIEALAGPDIISFHQDNGGPAAARNLALDAATGDIISFIDADDVWPPGKLATQLQYLDDHPEVDMVIGRTRFFGDLSEVDVQFDDPNERVTTGSFLGATLCRAAAVDRIGAFDPQLRTGEDYDWFLRAREGGVVVASISTVTLEYRVHPGGVSRNVEEGNKNLARALRRSIERRRAGGNSGALPDLVSSDDDELA